MKLQSTTLDSDKYRVIRELGRGGMGVVYLAEDQLLKRDVALKVLYDHLNRETAFVGRFQEEARSVSTLHHPNIVCVHGLERANDVTAIDMEYVEGQSLDMLMADVHVTPHVAVAIAQDVLSGLTACHDIGVVHRDIKPSNILIHLDGTAKITDFGLATAYASHLETTVAGNTSSGFYMGTPRYMPVEAWEGGEPSPLWDLYSFGIVLYELLSGQVAYQGDNPMAIMKKHLTDPLPSLRKVTSGLSLELTDLVDQLVLAPGEDCLLDSAGALEALQKAPELLELQDSNAATTIAAPRRRSKSIRPNKALLRRLGYSTVLVALVPAIGYLSYLAWQRRPIETHPGISERQVMEMRALGEVESGETWLIEPGSDQSSILISGFSASGITRMTGLKERDGDWSLTGGWAESVLPRAGSAQYGTARGTLHWPDATSGLHVQLERTREKDNRVELQTLAGSLASPSFDRFQFMRDLEGSELRQNLLYTEILPRMKEWAITFEAMLPSLEGGRHVVPYSTETLEHDGILDEPLWTRAYFGGAQGGRIGELVPQMPKVGPVLRARWREDAVFLATQIETSEADLQLAIAFLPAFEVSLKNSARFFLRIDDRGKPHFQYFQGKVERPGILPWRRAYRLSDDVNSVEIEIPTAFLKEHARPGMGKRWRINVQWYRVNASGEREILARWGDSDIMALEHGALLVFDRDIS
jgi:serine/threonine protein kinase